MTKVELEAQLVRLERTIARLRKQNAELKQAAKDAGASSARPAVAGTGTGRARRGTKAGAPAGAVDAAGSPAPRRRGRRAVKATAAPRARRGEQQHSNAASDDQDAGPEDAADESAEHPE